MRNPLNNKKGESLVEVVASCAIFGILIAMATTVLMSSMDITANASRTHKADGQISAFVDGNGATATPPTATAVTSTVNFSVTFDNAVGTLTGEIDVATITAESGGVDLHSVTAIRVPTPIT